MPMNFGCAIIIVLSIRGAYLWEFDLTILNLSFCLEVGVFATSTEGLWQEYESHYLEEEECRK